MRLLRLTVCVVACLAVVALTWVARGTLPMKRLEFVAYDAMLGRRAAAAADGLPPPAVAIVGIDETDIGEALGGVYPISDWLMAEAIDAAFAAGAVCVGVDIYRDFPAHDGAEQFAACLERHGRRVKTIFYPISETANISPPEAADPTTQVTANVAVIDAADDRARRARLTVELPVYDEQGGEQRLRLRSLGAGLAEEYLVQTGRLPEEATRPDLADPAEGLAARPPSFGATRWVPFTPNFGGYVGEAFGAADEHAVVLLDWRRQSPLPRVSLRQLRKGGPEVEAALKGRAVLIGNTARSIRDVLTTPIGTIYGVEYQGLAADYLIRAFATPLGTPDVAGWVKFAWMAFWGLVGCVVGWALGRSPVRLALGLAASAAALVVVAIGLLVVTGVWLPVAAPMLCLAGSALAVLASLLLVEGARQRAVDDMFKTLVDPKVLAELMRHSDAVTDGRVVPGQKRTATVLFTDLRNFTTMCQHADSDRVIVFLNAYLGSFAEVVRAHGGMVSKYIGDSVMAVFGVPLERGSPDEVAGDARAAVETALALRERMRRLYDDPAWPEYAAFDLLTRVGIHTGPLTAGGVGDARRFEYTVIGDTVNVASRLESLDKHRDGPPFAADHCRILISRATADLLGGRFALVPFGQVELKGRDAATDVFAVLGRAGEPASTSADDEAVTRASEPELERSPA